MQGWRNDEHDSAFAECEDLLTPKRMKKEGRWKDWSTTTSGWKCSLTVPKEERACCARLPNPGCGEEVPKVEMHSRMRSHVRGWQSQDRSDRSTVK